MQKKFCFKKLYSVLKTVFLQKCNLISSRSFFFNDKIYEILLKGICKQLLETLNDLHSRNIVHLDVNPDNIIIDNNATFLNK